MNITKKQFDDLNAELTIQLSPEDYHPKVDAVIKKYQKTAAINGFRPGKVPMGMIRKMYGKAILADELNKIISESISKFLSENKIQLLGGPMPKPQDELNVDWEKLSEYTFSYELGLAPQLNVDLSSKETFTTYEVKIDDTLLEKDIDDLRRRHGKYSNPETSGEGTILYGDFAELEASGNPKENGVKTTTTLAVDFIKNEEAKNKFTGLTKEQSVDFNPLNDIGEEIEVAAMLAIEKDNPAIKSDFRFTIRTINKIEKAELNQELFDKVFGPGTVKTEEEFKEKVRTELALIFKNDADKRLRDEMMERLLDRVNPSLPDNFLKRWLQTAGEKPLPAEQVDKEYHGYARSLKWKLIENNIIRDHKIEVTREEILNHVKQIVRNQFSAYGGSLGDEQVQQLAETYLAKDEKREENIYDSLVMGKVTDLLKNSFSVQIKEVSYDDFLKIMKEKN